MCVKILYKIRITSQEHKDDIKFIKKNLIEHSLFKFCRDQRMYSFKYKNAVFRDQGYFVSFLLVPINANERDAMMFSEYFDNVMNGKVKGKGIPHSICYWFGYKVKSHY